MVKNQLLNAGDAGLIPGLGRSSGEGNGNPLQCSCLGNLMDRGAWQATVYGVARVGHNSVTKQQYGCKHWSDGGQGGRKTLSLSMFLLQFLTMRLYYLS